jgi:two-component system, chemotaxis family, protein-glutamate methylesterase/glutaminase
MNSSSPVRVLVIDDSALMRQLLSALLSGDPDIEVVGTANDPLMARDRIKALNPDVITLDIEMPQMDGLTFLRKLMELRPMPVVMCSTLTQAGADATLQALEIGAVDFIAKPTGNVASAMNDLSLELRTKVKTAARARVTARRAAPARIPPKRAQLGVTPEKIIVMGASTGGVEALKEVLVHLPSDTPPILITQHMPPRFTAAFANRLNNECPMTIHEAAHDQPVERGHAYIAPGAHHLELDRRNGRFLCRLHDELPVSGHRPSVDVLFRSAARIAGPIIIGVILTGMGKDGAEGMLELRRARAITLGQDEESALVYGMPRVAFERGAVMRQCSLGKMSDAILAACGVSTAAMASA